MPASFALATNRGRVARELDGVIARLRRLPKIVEEVAPELAKELHAVTAENVAAQRGPDGKAWEPGQENNEVLSGAMKNVDTRAVGNVIVQTLRGPEAKHHLGIARGRVKREIIPTKKIPDAFVKAAKRLLERKIKEGE